MPGDSLDNATVSEATEQNAATRRAFLGAAGAAGATALAGCGGVLGGTDGPPTLRVPVWSGNYIERFEKAIRPIFESRFDAELELISGWNSLLAKIKSAPADDPPFDVTVACEPIYYNGRTQGLFEELRYEENIPNIDNVIQHYKDIRPYSHGAPVDGAPLSILYNTELKESVETWDDFSKSVVQQSNGVGVDSGFWIYPLLGAGIDTDAASGARELYQEQYHGQLLDTLEGWPIQGWATSGTDIWEQFRNGTIDAGQWYFDQVYYDMENHPDVEFAMPDSNAGWMNNWAVVRGTDKRTLGEEFINMLLDPEVQSKWAEEHPLFFTTKDMSYPDDLAQYLPTTAEEAGKYSIPQWDEVAPYSGKFSNKFKQMKIQ